MNRTVWKFDLHVTDEVSVMMPAGAEVLHVGTQDGNPTFVALWALVDAHAPQVTRRFAIRGTGHPAPFDEVFYVGTVIYDRVGIVWHVFEVG